MGAKIFEQSQITNITYGDHPAVHTEKGSIRGQSGHSLWQRLYERFSALPRCEGITCYELHYRD